MKLEIYGKQQTDNVVRLELNEFGDGIEVRVVDENGKQGTAGQLLIIEQGGVELCEAVDGELGFPLDEGGRLKLLP